MSEKYILGRKAQAMGEAEERVLDNGNRRTGTKGKGRKEPATVVRNEPSVSKPAGNATRMVEDSSVGKVAEMIEVSPVKTMIPKVSAEVSAEVPSVATPMPTKSLDMSCWRKYHKARRDTDNNKPFHIPLLRYTRGG